MSADTAPEPCTGPRPSPWWGRAAALVLLLLALFVPGLAIAGHALDAPQREVLGGALFTATLWLTGAAPIGLASLFPAAFFLATGVLGWADIPGLHLHRFVQLFFGAFVLALGLERWGVHRRIALFVIARVGTSKSRLVLGVMIASAGLSMWLNNTATTLMLVPIVTAVLLRFEEDETGPRDPRFGYCLLLGAAYASSVGGMVTPVGTAPNQTYLGQFATKFPDAPVPTFGAWTIAFLPLVLLFVPAAWWILTRVVYPFPRGDSSVGRESIRAERRALGRMSQAQRRMATLFVVTAFLWVFRADLRVGDFVVPGWTRLLPVVLGPERGAAISAGDHHVAMTMAVLLMLLPAGRGAVDPDALAYAGRRDRDEGAYRPLVNVGMGRRLPWDVLILLGGGFCIAAGFARTGLDDRVGEALGPLLVDQPRWLVIGTVALFVSFLTEITSNTATTVVLMPVLASSAVAASLDPRAVMLPGALAASAAFMLPAATPPNAVVFATRRIPIPQMARAGFLLNLTMVLIVLAVMEFWAADRLGIEQGVPAWAR